MGLGRNTSWLALHMLDLSYNDIGTQGAVELSRSLSWFALHTISLSCNAIDNEGYEALESSRA